MSAATQYAPSGDLRIAYQVHGEGPFDLVLVPPFMSNIEIMWDHPGWARLLGRLASFARLIVFDRRGNGMSDGIAGMEPLEEQIDDVRAVMAAAGSEQPVLISLNEGCALTLLFAASHPELVRALVLFTPLARMVQGPGYEWALTVEERAANVKRVEQYWGSSAPENPWTVFSGHSERQRENMARYQRLAMSPSAAAKSLAMAGEVDVRHVLPSIQCPTLVLRGAEDEFIDVRHSHYVAEHVPGARYVEIPGVDQVWVSEDEGAGDEIERFLTGTTRQAVSERVLATVLFTDIVGSTERAARLGDGAWRALLERHDALILEQVERHRGRVVKSLGDGGLAMFDGPSRAISSAVAIRDGVRDLGVEVRAGLHTGECEMLGDEDLGGLAVHIGARVSALAGPGEVLVSSTVRDLVVGSGVALAERGEHELKGVPGSWRLFAVEE
jgi:class 3 adenylate cyclase